MDSIEKPDFVQHLQHAFAKASAHKATGARFPTVLPSKNFEGHVPFTFYIYIAIGICKAFS